MKKYVVPLLVAAVLLPGCNTVRNALGYPTAGDPTVTLRAAESRWLLVQNPRYGDVPSEPEYVWVEEDKVPWTFKWGVPRRAALAPPEIVSQYGTPPGGGRVSPRQGVVTPTERGAAATRRTGPEPVSAVVAPVPEPKRGVVVWVDTTRIVIDLTAQDGLKPGSVVSLRRDRIPIVHPVTGEMLGELDEEVGTARVTEMRDKFSVAEIQTVAQGAEVRVKDRVVPK